MSDRIADAVEAMVRKVFGQRIDYLAAYPSRVVAQNADGTLELVPDSPRLSSYSKVPIRYGVPGVSATVASGARVLLEFGGGDARNPIATVWESASVTQLTLTATAIKLGGSGASQALVLGTSYSTHAGQLATAATALATAMTSLSANMIVALPAPNAAAALAAASAAATAATNMASAANSLASDVSTQNKTL